jgi:RNA polymerase sigma-70 factor (ECF subfamily)
VDANKPLIDHLPDEGVLFSLMGLYYDDLFRYGIKFTADADGTKDALNQFFIHFWENRDKLEKVDNLKAYLFVSFKRWLIAQFQQSKKNRLVSLTDNLNDELTEQSYEDYLVTQIGNEELALVLKHAIRTLPERQRKLLQPKQR